MGMCKAINGVHTELIDDMDKLPNFSFISCFAQVSSTDYYKTAKLKNLTTTLQTQCTKH